MHSGSFHCPVGQQEGRSKTVSEILCVSIGKRKLYDDLQYEGLLLQ